jgi:hypothetical protein
MRSIRFFLVLSVVPGAGISSTIAVIGQVAVTVVVGLLVAAGPHRAGFDAFRSSWSGATAVIGPDAGPRTASTSVMFIAIARRCCLANTHARSYRVYSVPGQPVQGLGTDAPSGSHHGFRVRPSAPGSESPGCAGHPCDRCPLSSPISKRVSRCQWSRRIRSFAPCDRGSVSETRSPLSCGESRDLRNRSIPIVPRGPVPGTLGGGGVDGTLWHRYCSSESPGNNARQTLMFRPSEGSSGLRGPDTHSPRGTDEALGPQL